MTTTPPEAPTSESGQHGTGTHTGPRVNRDQLTDLTRLRRTTGPGRRVAGVAGGLARHLDLDPLLVRVVLAVLALFGVGLLLYLVLWLVLPDDDDQVTFRLESTPLMVVLGVLALMVVLGITGGDAWSVTFTMLPLILVGAIVYAVVQASRASNTAPPAPPGAPVAASAPAVASDVSGQPVVASYDAGGTDQTPPWTPPRPVVPPRPPDPRKKGPLLFLVTLALISLALGVLGMVDLAGTDVALSAYPVLALAVCAAMLLLGSVYGRAGGIIALGLLLVPVATATTVAEELHDRTVLVVPTTAAEAAGPDHFFPAGTYTLDLTEIRDPEMLDGLVVNVQGIWGDIEVVVPDDVNVIAWGNVDGMGSIEVFGERRAENDWGSTSFQRRQRVENPVASFRLNVGLGMGDIRIVNEGDQR